MYCLLQHMIRKRPVFYVCDFWSHFSFHTPLSLLLDGVRKISFTWSAFEKWTQAFLWFRISYSIRINSQHCFFCRMCVCVCCVCDSVSFVKPYATYFLCHSYQSDAISLSSINPTYKKWYGFIKRTNQPTLNWYGVYVECKLDTNTHFMREFDLRYMCCCFFPVSFLFHFRLSFTHTVYGWMVVIRFRASHRHDIICECELVYSKWDNA